MSRHCPYCDAYPIATFENGDLVKLTLQHTGHGYPAEKLDTRAYMGDYQPTARSRHDDLPPMENRRRGGTMGGRSVPAAANPRPARSHTADGRQRRR